jgi:hypothetical protein
VGKYRIILLEKKQLGLSWEMPNLYYDRRKHLEIGWKISESYYERKKTA